MAARSKNMVSHLRRPFLGVVATLLIASCSRAPTTAPAEPPASVQLASRSGSPPPSQPPRPEEVGVAEAPAAPEPARDPAPERDLSALTDERAESKAARPSKPVPAPAASAASRRAYAMSGAGQGMAAGRALAPKSSAAPTPIVRDNPNFDTEAYAHVAENAFLSVANQPLSTFSIDVDTASYSNARRFLSDGTLPPPDAIRVEEWVNYFRYDYAPPTSDAPFAVNTEVTACPWNPAHRLVRIGIKGKELAESAIPARNLVFLLDVSGSMQASDKLPLVKRGLSMLADSLRAQDSLAIVVYAGSSGLVLPATSGAQRGRILKALDELEAGGSTNGGAGIQLAYSVAQRNFKKGGINRVILASDGDFNVGTTSEGELQRLIEEKRKSGVFLTVLGFGTGNVKDATMELLADKGNGNYAYIDSLNEARKVLVREAGSTLVTIAKDVKLQVEFNPARVTSYKLIGYENRLLAKEDFNDDRKDAGEIGAGHTVTALYEIVPKGAPQPATSAVDPLKYQGRSSLSTAAASSELLTVNIRFKPAQGDVSKKFSVVVNDSVKPLDQASADYRFGVAVANVALLLRGSRDVKQSTLDSARSLAQSGLGSDPHGDRREFLALIDQAKRLGQRGGLVRAAR